MAIFFCIYREKVAYIKKKVYLCNKFEFYRDSFFKLEIFFITF